MQSPLRLKSPIVSTALMVALMNQGAHVLAKAPIKVGFVYPSPVGDIGWTYQQDEARKQLESSLKGKVVTRFVENVPENADAERVIREMAKDGAMVIFATSFGYMNQVQKVAQQFPGVVFMHATGYKTSANVGVYSGRFYESRYLDGVLAGKLTKTNIAGYVAAFPIPEVVMGINAFALGMKSVNPGAQVRVIWVNSWFDPGKEREAALSLIANGADLLTHETDSPTTNQVCEEKGVKVLSYNSDESKYGPHAQVSGTVMTWGDYYVKVVSSVIDGTWKPGHTWGGFKMGLIRRAPYNASVPRLVREQVDRIEAAIASGAFHPFTGPIQDQDGNIRVPAGQTITDDALLHMDYFVQGVASKLPGR